MKKDPTATAHALTVVAAVWYALCVLWIAVARGSYMGMMGTWFHGVNISALPPMMLNGPSVIIGLITFAGFAWLTGYFFAVLYNQFVKR